MLVRFVSILYIEHIVSPEICRQRHYLSSTPPFFAVETLTYVSMDSMHYRFIALGLRWAKCEWVNKMNSLLTAIFNTTTAFITV